MRKIISQLCRHSQHNYEIKELLGKLHHPTDTFLVKTLFTEFLLQLSRNLRDNLFSVFSAFIPKGFTIDTLANMPTRSQYSRASQRSKNKSATR